MTVGNRTRIIVVGIIVVAVALGIWLATAEMRIATIAQRTLGVFLGTVLGILFARTVVTFFGRRPVGGPHMILLALFLLALGIFVPNARGALGVVWEFCATGTPCQRVGMVILLAAFSAAVGVAIIATRADQLGGPKISGRLVLFAVSTGLILAGLAAWASMQAPLVVVPR